MTDAPRWWVSWLCYEDDNRPMKTDLPGVLGWWESGTAGDGSYTTLCALIEAPTMESAKRTITDVGWPEQAGKEWRFFHERAADYVPGDRFPLAGSMTPTCPVCDKPAVEPGCIEALDYGPKMIKLMRRREGARALSLYGEVMQDDDDQWRCIVCLDAVPAAKVSPRFSVERQTPQGAVTDTTYAVSRLPIFTGYEKLCCGQEGQR